MQRRQRLKSIAGTFFAIGVMALSACSSKDRAVSPEEVRELVGSSGAVEARQKAEAELRSIVRAYDDQTALTLGLVVVRDDCIGGTARQWIDSNGDDRFKVQCRLRVTAYYGADPKNFVSTLDGILTAGDRTGSGIPFTHEIDGSLIDHYRADDKQDPEIPSLSSGSDTLSWDPIRDKHRSSLWIEEPDPCHPVDPPVTRCLREPETGTVDSIRSQYGMVFELGLGHSTYYTVYKDGRTVSHW